MTKSYSQKSGKVKTRYFFKVILTSLLCFSLNGCFLIGLLLQLAPLAASVLVEYSPPLKTDDGEILCVKALRHIQQTPQETKIVKSEYLIVLLDDKGTEISSLPLMMGYDYYPADSFKISQQDKDKFLLSLKTEDLNQEWEIKTTEFSVACLE